MAAPDPPLGTPVTAVRAGGGGRRWLPLTVAVVLAFLVGAGVGAVVVNTVDDDSTEALPTTTTTTTTTVPDDDERSERVCVAAIDEALDALDLVSETASAVSDLDAERLRSAIRRVDQVRPEVTRTLERCRRAVSG